MENSDINPAAQKYINHIKDVCARKKPLLVSQTIAYNHEKYLRDTLEGIIMQKTDFPFVAIVHDDASTDGTAEILREYAEKYPEIILPIYEEENQYSKRDGSLERVIRAATEVTGAKYVAMCEGDDYWTDPNKLQKQVGFLEIHPDYTMCFGNAVEHWQDGNKPDKPFSKIEDRDYSGLEMLREWIVPTASVIYRADVADDKRIVALSQSGKIIAGDILLFLTCASLGKVRGSSDFYSVYRRLDTGVVRAVMDKQPYRFMIHEITLAKGFGGEIRKHLKYRIANRVIVAMKELRDPEKRDWKYIFRGLKYAPWQTLRQIMHYL